MLLIPTRVLKTKNKGLGLFTINKLYKGSIVWKHNPLLDLTISQEEYELLPEVTKNYILEYAYLDNLGYHLDGDFTKHINHSFKNANIKFIEDYCITLIDIEEDEELLTDYTDFDLESKNGNLGFIVNED